MTDIEEVISYLEKTAYCLKPYVTKDQLSRFNRAVGRVLGLAINFSEADAAAKQRRQHLKLLNGEPGAKRSRRRRDPARRLLLLP